MFRAIEKREEQFTFVTKIAKFIFKACGLCDSYTPK